MIAAGLGTLRLPPREFWAATPREIAAAMRSLYGPVITAFDRNGLDELIARFPDQ